MSEASSYYNTPAYVSKIFGVCHDCVDRVPGCHGKCEKYKKAKVEYDEKKRRYDAARKAHSKY